MKSLNRYRPFPHALNLRNREWPNRVLTQAPQLTSTDLRDGNQALPVPMNVGKKLKFFGAIGRRGIKEIEVGFPSASDTEFAFNRHLIECNLIPDDVTIQVLVQAREDLIKRTIESLVGAKKAIIHLYNSTSPIQRRVVFNKSKDEIKALAVQGVRSIQAYLPLLHGTEVTLQYSPESFSSTETDFALEVCEAVMEEWGATSRKKVILNLPATVEVAMPNVFADQVEWFIRNLKNRESAIISVHTHNDRGTGIAAAELAMLAGAQRVEGTLFGNGERTGNADLVTLALNLYTQGIDPKLDLSDIKALRTVYEECTGMTVPDRHPYAGDLVFTAFSGSHQDAIRKGLKEQEKNGGFWDVPYLTIDPRDIGRTYEEVIRVNGQSGKGGITYLLESEYGIHLPKGMQIEFGRIVKDTVDKLGREVSAAEIRDMFSKEYIEIPNRAGLCSLVSFVATPNSAGEVSCSAVISHVVLATRPMIGDSYEIPTEVTLQGIGNGPLAAFISGLENSFWDMTVADYSEHALGVGNDASAIAYVCLEFLSGEISWGVGIDQSIEKAPIKAVLSALSRYKMRSA